MNGSKINLDAIHLSYLVLKQKVRGRDVADLGRSLEFTVACKGLLEDLLRTEGYNLNPAESEVNVDDFMFLETKN